MKVREMPYTRYQIEDFEKKVLPLIESIGRADNVEELIKIREAFIGEFSDIKSCFELAAIRNSLDTRDMFYNEERLYSAQAAPIVENICVRFFEAMHNSKFKAELDKILPATYFSKLDMLKRINDASILPDKKEEAEAVLEYDSLMSQMQFPFGGDTIPLSLLRGYFQSDDRDIRRNAYAALGATLEQNHEKIDAIFDRLVRIRHRMAQKLGFENFVDMGYCQMGRYDFDRKMVETFRENVVQHIVPFVCKLKQSIAQELGLGCTHFYDNEICIQGGEPKPMLNKDGIFFECKQMYQAMDPAIGSFMQDMIENEALDVVSRDGKLDGGYATMIMKYKQPFVFANFNGSAGDINVMTHEFGHALAMHAYADGYVEVGEGGMETAETHSMTMEMLCLKEMDRFFGIEADKYCYKHLVEAISFIPYGCVVDEFQHIIYENPFLTPKERNAVYLQLEQKYRPYLRFDDIPYLKEGTRWQYQIHIFSDPFYYIDYCLAQTVALEFFLLSRENYAEALSRYLEFVGQGGCKKFSDLVQEAGLSSPFAPGSLETIMQTFADILHTYKSEK